jgi:hypothetical protein
MSSGRANRRTACSSRRCCSGASAGSFAAASSASAASAAASTPRHKHAELVLERGHHRRELRRPGIQRHERDERLDDVSVADAALRLGRQRGSGGVFGERSAAAGRLVEQAQDRLGRRVQTHRRRADPANGEPLGQRSGDHAASVGLGHPGLGKRRLRSAGELPSTDLGDLGKVAKSPSEAVAARILVGHSGGQHAAHVHEVELVHGGGQRRRLSGLGEDALHEHPAPKLGVELPERLGKRLHEAVGLGGVHLQCEPADL